MSKTPIILDCDPGQDDAVALFMALASEKINLLGVTTSAGNVGAEKTYINAKKLLKLAQREDIEVCSGARKPLLRNLVIADYVHGESGLDGAKLPDVDDINMDKKAWEFIADKLRESEEKITIVATGPLTNIAILLTCYPELKEKIKEISIMGGACFGGNMTPNAEFNIYVDPEAAKIVFDSNIPIIMFGLDVTLKAQIFKETLDEIRAYGKIGETFSNLLGFYSKSATPHFLAEEGHVEGLHMHDPCAVAYLIDPTMFRLHECHVDVDTNDGYSLGATIVDYDGLTGKGKNAKVAFNLDLEKFTTLFIDSIKYFSNIK